MTLELNREYPELDDPKIFEHMVNLTLGQMKPILGHLRRAQHAKTTGCVAAEFRIADDVPSDLRYGVLSQPGRTFRAMVRFSNSLETFSKDSEGTARGLAIKLLEVGGTRAVPNDGDNTQDFLLINHPVFPFPDPKAYVEAIGRKSIPLIGKLVLLGYLALFKPQSFKIVMDIRKKSIGSPLELKYFSVSPFWLGPANGEGGHAVKYLAVPLRDARTTPPDHPENEPNYLIKAVASGLRSEEAVFDFKVHWQTDPVAMPVENVSAEWKESDLNPVKVATLRIPPQSVDVSDTPDPKCEPRSFTPWHALAEHRPMGGMNRLRRAVYLASVAKRTGH